MMRYTWQMTRTRHRATSLRWCIILAASKCNQPFHYMHSSDTTSSIRRILQLLLLSQPTKQTLDRPRKHLRSSPASPPASAAEHPRKMTGREEAKPLLALISSLSGRRTSASCTHRLLIWSADYNHMDNWHRHTHRSKYWMMADIFRLREKGGVEMTQWRLTHIPWQKGIQKSS